MLNVVLYEPEIPPNTGNIIRLCANIGAHLHLIHPLGFELDDTRLRRAGLDYHEWCQVRTHDHLSVFLTRVKPSRLLAYTTRADRLYTDIVYAPGDALLFGPETRGLPDAVLSDVPPAHQLRLPMQPGVRSLNLSNAVAVASYEVWRQWGFSNGV